MCMVKMVAERATKNTIKFTEIVDANMNAAVIGTMYVPKVTLKALGYEDGKAITLDIGVADIDGSEQPVKKKATKARKSTKK